MPNRIIKSGNKRFIAYITGAVFFLVALIATLIQLDFFTMDDVEDWIGTVIALTALIYGLGQSILAAINTDREDSTPPGEF